MLAITLFLGAWNNIVLALLSWALIIGLPIAAALFLLRALFRPDSSPKLNKTTR